MHFSKETKQDYEEAAFKKAIKIHKELPPGGILIFLTGKKEITYLCHRLEAEFKTAFVHLRTGSVKIQPLYSQLSPEKQYEVFAPVAEGVRQIVVSTNVAETSVTIPGIKYVIDCGRTKEKQFDKKL